MRRHRGSNWALTSSFFFFSSSESSSSRPSLVQHTSFLPSYSLSCLDSVLIDWVDHEEDLE